MISVAAALATTNSIRFGTSIDPARACQYCRRCRYATKGPSRQDATSRGWRDVVLYRRM